jgi:1,4-dihydroxy-2-naphthoyl-CoA hydrolase
MSLSIDQLNALIKPLFPGMLGVEVIEAGPDKVVGRMLVRPEMCTGGNILHGGAYMAFADTLGALATVINMPSDARTATIESKTNFIAGAPVNSVITGTSTPFHKGKTTQVWQTQITGDDGRVLAVVSQTQMVMRPKPAP